MATSGTINNTFRTGYAIRIVWEVTSQNVANNTSSVTAKVQLVSLGSSYTINSSVSKSGSLTINGTKYSFSFTSALNGNQVKTLYTKTVTVTHAADGTKTCAFSCTAGIDVTLSGTYWGDVTASGNGVFNTIPRASSISSVTASVSVNGTNAVAVSISRASSSFTHTVVIKFGSYSNTITGVGTSTSYAIPVSWLNAIPSATSGTASVTVTTYSGSTKIGSAVSKNFTITVPSTVIPTISSVAVADTNSTYATKFGGLVQNKSKAKFTITAAGTYGSTITSYKTVIEGKTYTGASPTTSVLTGSGNVTAKITVTDSRGRTATVDKTFNRIPYTAPSIDILDGFRTNAAGVENYEGTNAKISVKFIIAPASNKNTSSYKVEYKLQAATTWTSIETGSGYSLDKAIITGSLFNADSTYQIRLTVSDYFTTITKTVELPTAFTLMDLNKSGHGIAFGKVSEKTEGVEFALPTFFSHGETPEGAVQLQSGVDCNSLTTSGFYSFSAAVRATMLNMPITVGSGALITIDMGEAGQKMQIAVRCSDVSEIWERMYFSSAWNGWKKIYNGSGKILWSGAYYMQESHIITLNEPISKQPNGIVLVFSRYASGTVGDHNFNSFFVPKVLVAEKSGMGHMFIMGADPTFLVMAAKYLYIKDTTITGHAGNIATGTSTTGITYTNNGFVLRYVIGV